MEAASINISSLNIAQCLAEVDRVATALQHGITMVRPMNDESQLRDLPNQPYESLRQEFREQVESLQTVLNESLEPKQLMNKIITGPMLVSLAESYVEAAKLLLFQRPGIV